MIRPTPNSIAGQHGIKFFLAQSNEEIIGCAWMSSNPSGAGRIAGNHCTFTEEGTSCKLVPSTYEEVRQLFRSGATFCWIQQKHLTEHQFFNFNQH